MHAHACQHARRDHSAHIRVEQMRSSQLHNQLMLEAAERAAVMSVGLPGGRLCPPETRLIEAKQPPLFQLHFLLIVLHSLGLKGLSECTNLHIYCVSL